jgi:hypothetical protein
MIPVVSRCRESFFKKSMSHLPANPHEYKSSRFFHCSLQNYDSRVSRGKRKPGNVFEPHGYKIFCFPQPLSLDFPPSLRRGGKESKKEVGKIALSSPRALKKFYGTTY